MVVLLSLRVSLVPPLIWTNDPWQEIQARHAARLTIRNLESAYTVRIGSGWATWGAATSATESPILTYRAGTHAQAKKSLTPAVAAFRMGLSEKEFTIEENRSQLEGTP
jgi:hypothetical protein